MKSNQQVVFERTGIDPIDALMQGDAGAVALGYFRMALERIFNRPLTEGTRFHGTRELAPGYVLHITMDKVFRSGPDADPAIDFQFRVEMPDASIVPIPTAIQYRH